MLRSITASITALSLLSPAHVLANHCVSPFTSNLQAFQLQEKLSCTQTTSPVVLNIIPGNQTAITGKWQPTCDTLSPRFELFADSLVVDFSDTMANALSKIVRVSNCDGAPIFLIDRTPMLETLPSGQKISVSTRVFAEDDSRSLIGYVAATEDLSNGLTVRGADTKILAQAVKAFHRTPDCGAIWTVTNSGQTVQIANVISFLITLKDNDGFSCVSSPTYPDNSYAMFALGIGVGAIGLALLEFGIWYGYRAYQRHQANRREATSLLQER
jgi:hypothetical protein